MNDFRNGAEFQALMVSLDRINTVNQVTFEAAQAAERKPQDHHDRRRLQQENKLLGRQLRAPLLCSAYSIAEAAIIGLTKHGSATNSDINSHFDSPEKAKPTPLHRSQFVLQEVFGLCKTDKWNEDWLDLHRLRLLRNRLVHSGGVGEEDNLSKKIDRDAGFAAWVEPMFEGSESEIYVLVIGEMHFRQRLQKLQKFIYDIDAELPRIVTE